MRMVLHLRIAGSHSNTASIARPRAPTSLPTGGPERRPLAECLPLTLRAYELLTAAATPFAHPLLSRRVRRGKEDPQRMAARRGETTARRPAGLLVWVHGASVGELAAAIPLIERLSERGLAVLVTTGTVTSAQLAAKRLPPGV